MALTITTAGYNGFYTFVLGNMFSGVTTPKMKVYDNASALIQSITATQGDFDYIMSGVNIIGIDYVSKNTALVYTIPPATTSISAIKFFTTIDDRSAMGELEYAKWDFTTTPPAYPNGGSLTFSQFVMKLAVE